MFSEDGGVGTTSSSSTRRSRASRAGAVRTIGFLAGLATRFLAAARFGLALIRAARLTVFARPAGVRDRFAALFFARVCLRLAMLMSFVTLTVSR
jgi:hypothetical protein